MSQFISGVFPQFCRGHGVVQTAPSPTCPRGRPKKARQCPIELDDSEVYNVSHEKMGMSN